MHVLHGLLLCYVSVCIYVTQRHIHAHGHTCNCNEYFSFSDTENLWRYFIYFVSTHVCVVFAYRNLVNEHYLGCMKMELYVPVLRRTIRFRNPQTVNFILCYSSAVVNYLFIPLQNKISFYDLDSTIVPLRASSISVCKTIHNNSKCVVMILLLLYINTIYY